MKKVNIKWGIYGGLVGGVAYALLHLAFFFMGPDYRAIIDLPRAPIELLSWAVVTGIVGLILGLIFGKSKKVGAAKND